MKKILTAAFLSISIAACGQKPEKQPNSLKECVRLNDEGVKYLMKPSMNDKRIIDTAISYFYQAISCNSKYFVAYVNLANAYENKKEYKSAISVYDQLLYLSNNYPGFLTRKGILFEKMDKVDSAKTIYLLSIQLYQKKLQTSKNDIDAIRGLIYVKALTLGVDSALHELNKQMSMHPDLSEKLDNERYLYENFDRKAITNRAFY